MQNQFVVGDEMSLSSSEGESVTIPVDENDGGDEEGDEEGNEVPAAQQQAATEARKGKRARMPRNFFQAGPL